MFFFWVGLDWMVVRPVGEKKSETGKPTTVERMKENHNNLFSLYYYAG